MSRQGKGKNDYNQRLKVFLQRIERVGARERDLQAIMDTVPFQDLEIALMMATSSQGRVAGR